MTTGSETIAAAIRDGLHELAEWLREARQATASRETPRMGPVAANTPEPDPVGTPEAAKPSGTKSFPVMVSVDTDEIEEWAGRMADANRHGVAHVLYRALELIEAGAVDWLNPDGQPPTPRPMTPPCRKCGMDERACERYDMGCCAECSHPSGRWEWVADDEVVVRLRPGYSDHTLRDAAKGLEALGWPLAAFALEALADGIDRKEGK